MKKLLILFILVIYINIFSMTSINPLPFNEEGNLKFEFVDKTKISASYGVLDFVEVCGGIETDGIAKIKINTNLLKPIPLIGAISFGYFPGFYSLNSNYFITINGMIGYKNEKIVLSGGSGLFLNSINNLNNFSIFFTGIWKFNDVFSLYIENTSYLENNTLLHSDSYLYINSELKDIFIFKTIGISAGIKNEFLNNNSNFIFGASTEIDILENIKKLK